LIDKNRPQLRQVAWKANSSYLQGKNWVSELDARIKFLSDICWRQVCACRDQVDADLAIVLPEFGSKPQDFAHVADTCLRGQYTDNGGGYGLPGSRL